jgi:hypothetical protein
VIHLHATKKIFAKLPVNDQGFLPKQSAAPLLQTQGSLPPSVLSGCHTNVLIIRRRQCIIMVHNTTRFSLLAIHSLLNQTRVRQFKRFFEEALMNTLIKIGTNNVTIQRNYFKKGLTGFCAPKTLF